MKNFLQLTMVILCLVLALNLSACGSTTDSENEVSSDATEKVPVEESNKKQENDYKLIVDGDSISLPCTLKELNKMGIDLFGDLSKEQIYSAQNQTFYMVSATVEGSDDFIQLQITTGEDTSKGAENAVVEVVTNNMITKDIISVNQGIGIDSRIEDAINVFGKPSYSTAETDDELRLGFHVVRFGGDEFGVKFSSRDGVIVSVELQS